MHSRQAIKFVNCIKKGAGAMLQRETPFFGAQGLCTFPVRTYITQAANLQSSETLHILQQTFTSIWKRALLESMLMI